MGVGARPTLTPKVSLRYYDYTDCFKLQTKKKLNSLQSLQSARELHETVGNSQPLCLCFLKCKYVEVHTTLAFFSFNIQLSYFKSWFLVVKNASLKTLMETL